PAEVEANRILFELWDIRRTGGRRSHPEPLDLPRQGFADSEDLHPTIERVAEPEVHAHLTEEVDLVPLDLALIEGEPSMVEDRAAPGDDVVQREAARCAKQLVGHQVVGVLRILPHGDSQRRLALDDLRE